MLSKPMEVSQSPYRLTVRETEIRLRLCKVLKVSEKSQPMLVAKG